MTLQQALSYTGNEYQGMSYQELVEVTKAMAEAARRRLSRTSEGPAFEQIKRRALGQGRTVRVRGLSYVNGKVRISQKFKGKNKMPMSDLRTLRKELYNYLKDPTSTQKGYKEFVEEAERIHRERMQVRDLTDMPDNPTEQDFLNMCNSDSELIYFAENHLGWMYDSSRIYAAIIECGGYDRMGTQEFFENLRDYIQRELDSREAPMDAFDYDDLEEI